MRRLDNPVARDARLRQRHNARRRFDAGVRNRRDDLKRPCARTAINAGKRRRRFRAANVAEIAVSEAASRRNAEARRCAN